MKLYRVEITSYPDGALSEDPHDDGYSIIDPEWQPEGWAAYSEEQWGKVRDFWWPPTKTLYRSRSGATDRARLIESFGATAVVIESEPIVWLTPEVKRARTIAKLRAQIAELEALS